MDRTTPGQYLRLVLLLAILAATLLYPIWLTVEGAFRGEDEAFTLHHVGVVFTDPVLRGGLLNALLIAWGNAGAADLNGDGLVNGSDLAQLLEAWGPAGG